LEGSACIYDLRGNLTSDGSQSYAYDLDNHLTSVGQSISYKYDPFGKRIEKNVSGSVTKYIHSGDQIIEEWEGDTLARKYICGAGIDEPLVMITANGAKYYYHFDALGLVRNLTDSTGSAVASYEYGVYGQFNLTGNAHGNPYSFTGRQWDPESGLYYYRARYYSPVPGRFLQTDPIGYLESSNLYIYVYNNPILSIDPFGLCPEMNCAFNCTAAPGHRMNCYLTSYYNECPSGCIVECHCGFDQGHDEFDFSQEGTCTNDAVHDNDVGSSKSGVVGPGAG